MAGGPGWDRTSDLPRVKLKRCQKRAVIAGRTGRTGPSLRVCTTQSERHGGCTADEIAPVTRTHGCGVPSARRRSPADVDDYPLAAGIWLPVKRPARRDHPTVAPSKCHWPRCRHRFQHDDSGGNGPSAGFSVRTNTHQAGVLTTRHCNRSGKPGHHELRPLV
jgi:hypothetical protein